MNKNQWLNRINGDYFLSQPKNSVYVMALYAAHKPNTEKELVTLIDSHYKTTCQCGIKSKGTLKMFAQKLYEAQSYNDLAKQLFALKNKGEICTFEECFEYVYDLYVRSTIKKAGPSQSLSLETLKQKLPTLIVEESNSTDDLAFAVDIVVKDKNNNILAGVQVKSNLYESKTAKNAHKMNIEKNQKFQKPVFYLIYEKLNNGKIILKNSDSVVDDIYSLILPKNFDKKE
ncbi:MAG: hypothetical protein LBU90_01915 [Bacteroidales bacterium]|nr:hypothetical protein [Bacteroidales bacterium]